MHRDIIEIRNFQEEKMDDILQNISRINEQMQHQEQQQTSHGRSDSLRSQQTLLDDKVDSLSINLNKIAIAATDVKASFTTPRTGSTSNVSHPPSLTGSDAERPPVDSSPDITHVEPLRELALQFKQQAAHDLEHLKYKDAESHQLEAIACYKELHDAHKVAFDSYHDMKMKLAQIFEKLKKYDEAKRIYQLAARQPLKYERELGWKSLQLDPSEDTEHRAHLSHKMAELSLQRFVTSSESSGFANDWALLYEAECNAKRAFRIRRNKHGRDHTDCKESARLLCSIYNNLPDKRMYSETYDNMYLIDDDHRNVLLAVQSGSNTSRSRSLVPSDHSSLSEAVKNHDVPIEDVRAIMSNATLTDLEHVVAGKSVVMVAMDCVKCNKCARCTAILDKLFRLGADRNAPLAYAVKKDRIADCQFLLDHDADIDWLDANRLTPLMHAIKHENPQVTAYLLSQNADINVRGEKGQTALHIATQTRNEEVFKLILKADNLNPDARDDNGLTALHHAAKQDNVRFAKRLARAGADLDIKDRSATQRTALWIAVKEDKHELAEALLKEGAQVDLSTLPRASRDIRNLLHTHQRRNAGSSSVT